MLNVGKTAAHKQLELYLKPYQAVAVTDQISTTGNDEIPIEQVKNGFVIARGQGDLLYLDTIDNFSVWVFYHDGCYVEKVSNSFNEWLSMVKKG